MIVNLKKEITTLPLISIITPVLNGRKFLEQAIISILNQKYANIEYLIIDGGSKDGTLDIIKKYENKITRWISESDNGISDAFNKGIKLSEGELIGIVNCDDWLESNAVEFIVEKYLRSNCDVICGAVRFWEKNKTVITSYPEVERIKKETSIHHAGVFVRKSVYEKFGMYDISYKYAMDYELLLRFKMTDVKFCTINSIISNRRLEGVSYKSRKHALIEVKKARSKYFPKTNVIFNYYYIYIKDFLGRILKNSFMKPIYIFYWNGKNKRLTKGRIN